MSVRNVNSVMTFLSRSKVYDSEKPYATDFLVDDIKGAKMTNHTFDVRPVFFQDARGVPDLSLDRNGFCFVKAKTSLQAEDATSERTSQMTQYMNEIAAILRDKFPQYVEVLPMDFQVRKRHADFPNGSERRAEFAQPSTMAHTDFSRRGAFLRLADIFPDQSSQYDSRSFDLINVWKVLKGPNNDWPLALCDYSLVDTEKDVTTNDALHYRRVGENSLLHHNPSHQWYYLSDAGEDDLIIFRNVDSEGKLSRGFHASFHNPNSDGGLRHSIEVRLVAFRD